MNKIIIFISIVVSIVLVNLGMTAKTQVAELKGENAQLQDSILDMKQRIKEKEFLPKQAPVPISTEYSVILNEIRFMEGYGPTRVTVQLEGAMDTEDIATHYEDTPYKGIKGLKIQFVVDKISKETDMGDLLDDIHLLERNTDFMVSEISKDNNKLIVKGEVYGF